MNTTTVAITLIIYKVVLVLVGVWATRRTESNTDFFLGGRRLGGVVSSLSYAASAASAWTLLGFSGATYALGVSAIWIVVGLCTATATSWFLIGPRLMDFAKRHDCLTVPDVVITGTDARHRRTFAAASSAIILFAFLFYVAAQFQGAGATFASSFDVHPTTAILLGGAIVTVYTWLGGFWAVSVTDALQGILMLIAAIAMPIAAVHAIGGPATLLSELDIRLSEDLLSLTAGHVSLAAAGMVVGFLAIGLGMFGQPHLLARFMATRDGRAMRVGGILTVSWYVVVFTGIYISGLAGRVLLSDLENSETVFFELNRLLFDPIIASILIAAVLSAIMLTADSMLLVCASAIAHDLGLRRIFPGKELLISRIVIAVLAAAAVTIAIALPASIFDRVLFAWTALGSAFGPIIISRLFGVELRPAGIWLSVFGSFFLAVVTYLAPNATGDWLERVLPFAFAATTIWHFRRRPR